MAYIQGLCKSVFVKSRLSPVKNRCVFSLPVFCQESPPFTLDSLLSCCVWQCVAASVYSTVELFFVSHPGLGGKYREECRRLDERRRTRRGATETEGGVHSSGILPGWSVFAARSVSTIDVNTVLDTEFQQQPPHPLPTPPPPKFQLYSQLELKPQWKRYGGQHLKMLINGYFCMRRRRERLYFVK